MIHGENQGSGILVVDDEEFLRGVTTRILTKLAGRRPDEASNGREAITALREHGAQIQLVVCDLMMPDMDGIELVRHLAELPTPPAIVFLSGAQSSLLRAAETLARAYGLAVLASLAKPVTSAAFEAILKNLSVHRAARAVPAKPGLGEEDLVNALRQNEFCFHYQPKIDLRNRRIESAEALVRWRHPVHGLLAPGAFLDWVESGPLVGQFTEHLVQLGFAQLAEWHRTNLRIPIAINLSPITLSDVALPDRFAALAKHYSLEPRDIIFEVTETGIAKHEAIFLEIVTRLHVKGFRLSIDDFGTGQSSLMKLEALPFSELKVDRQFVHEAHKSNAKRAILEASLGLARGLQLKTVAEGVEVADDLDLLTRLGCDVAQGFLISRPLAEHEFFAWATASARGAAQERPPRDL